MSGVYRRKPGMFQPHRLMDTLCIIVLIVGGITFLAYAVKLVVW